MLFKIQRKLPYTCRFMLILVILLTSFFVPPKESLAFSYQYSTFPEGKLGISRPEIGVKLTLNESLHPSSFTFYLNDKEVKASYNPSTTSFYYKPSSDLPAGTYKARLILRYDGYQDGTLEWGFTILPGAMASFAAPNSEQQTGLQAINDYRLLNHLPPVIFNDALNAAAQKHAEYLANNKIDVANASISLHDEDPAKPGYIGKSLGERMSYVGYSYGAGEDAAYNHVGLVEAIDSLFAAPYHRTPFLSPNMTEIGVYQVGDYHVIEFGYREATSPQFIVSPADGDTFVPIAFNGHETPDPIRLHKQLDYPIGYPLMGAVSAPGITRVTIQQADLTDEKGGKVELLNNQSSNDDHLDTEVILLPVKPLLPDSTYTAHLKLNGFDKSGAATTFEKTWKFRTEPSSGIGAKKLHADSQTYMLQLNQLGLERSHVVTFGLDAQDYALDQIRFPMKQKPYIADGTSFLYIRDLAEALGASVTWDDARKAAIYTKKDKTVTFFTGRNVYAINGVEATTPSPAKLINETTMIPVRLLSETLGAKVEFIDSTRTVKITY
jgi:uncharacterized protein YkwD